MGARTVLIEADRMGGDCLNTGCVPSKSLIAAAASAANIRRARNFGVRSSNPEVDFVGVHRHVRSVIGAIAPHDSEDRFAALGCTVIRGRARFLGPRTVEAAGTTVKARRFVIATGSHPSVPPIPGLDRVPYFTNETLFENTVLPEHLVIIGAGPVGIEMAQAFRRLGAKVSVLDIGPILPKDDPEASDLLRSVLRSEDIGVLEHVRILNVQRLDGTTAVRFQNKGDRQEIACSHLLIAAGRQPTTEGLNLDAAGVRWSHRGIDVNSRMRTRNSRIYAIGDVAGDYQFTHAAAYQAGVVLQNALLRLPAKVDYAALPWVTYTDPEIAQVGMTEQKARETYGEQITVLRTPLSENDRAQAEGMVIGFIKVIAAKRGKILGATIVAPHAGELILPWALAISQKIGLSGLARVIAPYPTLSEITKRAAGSYFTSALFGPWTRRFVRILGWLG